MGGIKMEAKLRKPTNEEKEEFDQIDRKLDALRNKKVKERMGSNIELRDKIFMKISDVDRGDAEWFKSFCDKHTDGKQFLGLKVIRQVISRIDPLLENILTQLNNLDTRIGAIELTLSKNEEPEDKIKIPKTQGGGRK